MELEGKLGHDITIIRNTQFTLMLELVRQVENHTYIEEY